MLLFKLLLPLMAQLDPFQQIEEGSEAKQMIEENSIAEEDPLVLDDSDEEIYEIEFNPYEDLISFEEELGSSCPE